MANNEWVLVGYHSKRLLRLLRSKRSLTRNENPLKKLERIDKPLTIKQDQQEKQVINTIREVLPEMYTPAHLLIPP